jgi:hypothetical protein
MQARHTLLSWSPGQVGQTPSSARQSNAPQDMASIRYACPDGGVWVYAVYATA